jgi:hypothetical protein
VLSRASRGRVCGQGAPRRAKERLRAFVEASRLSSPNSRWFLGATAPVETQPQNASRRIHPECPSGAQGIRGLGTPSIHIRNMCKWTPNDLDSVWRHVLSRE